MARKGMMVGDSEHKIQDEMLEVGVPAPDFNLIANRLEQQVTDGLCRTSEGD